MIEIGDGERLNFFDGMVRDVAEEKARQCERVLLSAILPCLGEDKDIFEDLFRMKRDLHYMAEILKKHGLELIAQRGTSSMDGWRKLAYVVEQHGKEIARYEM
jgi:hypothetical protein